MTRTLNWFLVGALIAVTGCAGEVLRHPTDLLSANGMQGNRYVVKNSISLMLDSGYARNISAGTEFAVVGRTSHGEVLRPLNATFTVEGAHMHEAYPVVSEGKIVGFYLPVEKAFSPLSKVVDFSTYQKGE